MPKSNATLAVFYARCSTTEQHLSPAAQRQAAEAWANANGVTIASAHVDAGISGGTDLADRPALAEALGALKAHGAGILLVAKLDRVARDVAVFAAVERAAARLGARIASASGEGNGSTDADSFMRHVLAAAAEYERALIRSRTRAALKALRAQGYRAGTVPYGYTADASGKLISDPYEQTVVGLIVTCRGDGMTHREIVAKLAARGIVSRRGRPLGLAQVQGILKTQTLQGALPLPPPAAIPRDIRVTVPVGRAA